MLSTPTAGWCKLTIGDFTGNPSYITDVPTDLLNAFIDYYKNYMGTAYFDEEGSDFILLLFSGTVYIIYNDYYGESSLHTFHDIDIDVLAMGLIYDIMTNIDAWSEFYASYNDYEAIQNNKTKLISLTNKLQELITNA